MPSDVPSVVPSEIPSTVPSHLPSMIPSTVPSDIPSQAITKLFGGFHLLLETHKKRGSIFGTTHLRDFFSKLRNSDKQQLDWVMGPEDPKRTWSQKYYETFLVDGN
mmetsp:Transcript_31618/g.36892  ORF Transcript_31618/g.36892 Transcript_31618/m.36892 type:complete len:106 (+) Transcript_31618:791-1108(+)